MKNKIIAILAVVIAVLLGAAIMQRRSNDRLKNDYEQAVHNLKAYNSELNDECIAYKFTIEQLEYINDSSIRQLDSLRKALKIKDDKIKQLGKTKQKVYVHDTITINGTDTVFVNGFEFDTCISDQWRQTCIQLEYPNCISVDNQVNLETDCLLYVSRQTVNPPCKTWIGRLFQKKHDVYNLKVIEHNPYATTNQTKLIIIQD